ncbi:MFS transporter [Reyranella aquatilis]|uniref:MFS transporter n=1 Tax=Reyranella aquatilis TaxID=2035356 RepID=A0ABS8KVT2_9HYPH|nr:MFS transporter [Reyranella aquatilis]MCC8430170.1 MFS transporter [Reyranella aquatilis]
MPFAAGYYLSYLFRTINTLISGPLSAELGLDAANLGLLTAVYFLVLAGAQIPIGVLLDRFGPRRVQSVLLVVAAGGAALFAASTGLLELLIARAMIGIGVAAALMAGLKAIVTWFPRERVALINGYMIMLGALGAVTATAPAEWLMGYSGWRGLFELSAAATLAAALLIFLAVPDKAQLVLPQRTSLKLGAIYRDPRFWRIAPLSASCIGSAWSLQGLWAAPWLADVEGFNREALIAQLFLMAIAVCLGALLLGTIADRLRRRGIGTETLFAAVVALFVIAELALIMRLPLPSLLPWIVVSIVSAATVLSFAIIAEYFPSELAARANGSLNVLHFGWAFVVQYGTGLILEQWTPQDGHYPAIAYQVAFAVSVAVQIVALAWFVVPWLRSLDWRAPASFLRALANDNVPVETVTASTEIRMFEPHESGEW